jgi:hypothetical protein
MFAALAPVVRVGSQATVSTGFERLQGGAVTGRYHAREWTDCDADVLGGTLKAIAAGAFGCS